jgi:hypothetical protein
VQEQEEAVDRPDHRRVSASSRLQPF